MKKRTLRHTQVPELVLSFDTETTGLDVRRDRAISYGFVAYRFQQRIWSDYFFVRTDKDSDPAAERVHKLSREAIEAKSATHDVLSMEAGLTRAINSLATFHKQGAYILGANVSGFDLAMLRESAIALLSNPLQDASFDISLLRIIDVVAHDIAIESREKNPRRRGLEKLCAHYGVPAGGHDALEDARAAAEVFFRQVEFNRQGQGSLALGSDEVGAIAQTWGAPTT